MRLVGDPKVTFIKYIYLTSYNKISDGDPRDNTLISPMYIKGSVNSNLRCIGELCVCVNNKIHSLILMMKPRSVGDSISEEPLEPIFCLSMGF